MDKTIDRDSEAMREFAKAASYFTDEVTFYCDDMQCTLNAASSVVKSENAVKALREVTEMLESIRVKVNATDQLSYRILKSAELVEQSDELI